MGLAGLAIGVALLQKKKFQPWKIRQLFRIMDG
jgi:hypothetical protein